MKHESFRELLALRLYGELEANDGARLADHLTDCPDCRQFARELAAGLGALRAAPVQQAEGEIPADWRERLRRSTAAETGPGRTTRRWASLRSPLWASAAAFAAGVLVATLLMRRANDNPIDLVASNDGARVPSIYERFNGSTPPPQATTAGQLARWGEYMKR
jgi:anti-sigma factor RsiW